MLNRVTHWFWKTIWISDFSTDSIYILGDPFEGEVCLCWEIPWEVAMSVQTLQQDGAEKRTQDWRQSTVENKSNCFCETN